LNRRPEAGERRHRRLDNAAHDVGCEEPGRGGNRGAECEQRATLRDRRQFADDGMADHVDDRGHGDADRERDIACMPGTYGMTAKARPPATGVSSLTTVWLITLMTEGTAMLIVASAILLVCPARTA